ncbi:GntR family transcriptional regulator [Lacticigenium naphthae]|uniref:GntR family transcriptional regulator n=1 Tax=Lacticigenium naphthae TaxID=515351 RepID=UPI0003F5A995|nr:GntR family transcriptional regulator [Lacticigenium naphthae]
MKQTFNSRDPLYLQVVRQFKEKMANGQYKPGQEVPSRRELASQLGINPNTAQRAYKLMEEEDLVHTGKNMPSKLTGDLKKFSFVRQELIQEAVDQFIEVVKSLGIPLEEAQEELSRRYQVNGKASESDD